MIFVMMFPFEAFFTQAIVELSFKHLWRFVRLRVDLTADVVSAKVGVKITDFDKVLHMSFCHVRSQPLFARQDTKVPNLSSGVQKTPDFCFHNDDLVES